MSSLSDTVTQHDEAISAALATFFVDRISGARAIHPRYELLWQELSRVAQNGGKQLRPKMLLMAYQACGGTYAEKVIPAAAAVEILHASLLIHDDIIDRELTRRGQLNVSGEYERTHYAEVTDNNARRHYSDAAALLGGDLLLASSIELLGQCDVTAEHIEQSQRIMQRVIFEVAAGQLLDSEMAFLGKDGASAELVAHYKTASYSFVGPLLIGAELAGAPRSTADAIEQFAINTGIAFQLTDDLIGVFGDEKTSGKSTSSDLREGKKTYLVEQFMAHAGPTEKAAFQASFGNPDLHDATADSLKLMLQSSGAQDRTIGAIDHYVTLARQALDILPFDDRAKSLFETLLIKSTERDM